MEKEKVKELMAVVDANWKELERVLLEWSTNKRAIHRFGFDMQNALGAADTMQTAALSIAVSKVHVPEGCPPSNEEIAQALADITAEAVKQAHIITSMVTADPMQVGIVRNEINKTKYRHMKALISAIERTQSYTSSLNMAKDLIIRMN